MRSLIFLLIIFFPISTFAETIVTVCSSGCDYTSIQNAIDATTAPATIKVGQGTYAEQVIMKDGVNLQGGWNSICTELNPSLYQTTIDECPFLYCEDFDCYFDYTVYASDNSVIENFSIIGCDGGIYAENVSATISNITLSLQSGSSSAYGIRLKNSDSTIENCTINTVEAGCSGLFECFSRPAYGIAIDSSSPTIKNTIIKKIYAGDGFPDCWSCQPAFCCGYGDGADAFGIYLSGCPLATIENVLIYDLQGGDTGRPGVPDGIPYGIYMNSSSPTITNCTLAGQSGGYGLYATGSSAPSVQNSIIWTNSDDLFGFNAAQVSYSDIEDGDFNGIAGNISTDPIFEGSSDFHLQSGSPCIDSGTSDNAPVTDIEGELRFDDFGVPNTGGGEFPYYDMGAFEYIPPFIAVPDTGMTKCYDNNTEAHPVRNLENLSMARTRSTVRTPNHTPNLMQAVMICPITPLPGLWCATI